MKFDLGLLRSMSGNDERFVSEMVGVFMSQYSDIKGQMHTACSSRNWPEVGRLAHKLKSSIDTMSISSLKQLIRDIEQGGKEGKDVGEECTQLFSEMDELIEEMKAHFP